jgi:hypothetical protein
MLNKIGCFLLIQHCSTGAAIKDFALLTKRFRFAAEVARDQLEGTV